MSISKNIGTLKSHICKSCINLLHKTEDIPHLCTSCNKKSTVLEDILLLSKFELFNVSKTYKINKTKLYKEYCQLQKLVHPDLIISFNDKEAIKEAENASSIISKSYHLLLNDYERAKYLLKEVYNSDCDMINLNENDLEVLMNINFNVEEIENFEEIDKEQCRIEGFLKDVQVEIENLFENIEKEGKIEFVERVSYKVCYIKYLFSVIESLNKKRKELSCFNGSSSQSQGVFSSLNKRI